MNKYREEFDNLPREERQNLKYTYGDMAYTVWLQSKLEQAESKIAAWEETAKLFEDELVRTMKEKKELADLVRIENEIEAQIRAKRTTKDDTRKIRWAIAAIKEIDRQLKQIEL